MFKPHILTLASYRNMNLESIDELEQLIKARENHQYEDLKGKMAKAFMFTKVPR